MVIPGRSLQDICIIKCRIPLCATPQEDKNLHFSVIMGQMVDPRATFAIMVAFPFTNESLYIDYPSIEEIRAELYIYFLLKSNLLHLGH